MIVIVGGGTAGCLLSYFLSKNKIEHILIEKGRVGLGGENPLNGSNSGGYLSKICSSVTESSLSSLEEEFSFEHIKEYLHITQEGAKIHKELCDELNVTYLNKKYVIRGTPSFIEKELSIYKKLNRNPILKDNSLIFGQHHIFNSEELCNSLINEKYCTLVENKSFLSHDESNIYTSKGDIPYNHLFFAINNTKEKNADRYFTFMIHGESSVESLPYTYPVDNDYGIYYCAYDNIMFLGGRDISMKEYSIEKHRQTLEDLKIFAKKLDPKFKYISENFGTWTHTKGEIPKVKENNNVYEIYGCEAIGQSTYCYIIKNFIKDFLNKNKHLKS